MSLELKLGTIIIAQTPPLPSGSGADKEKQIEFLSNDMALMVGVGVIALLVLAFFARQSFGGGGRGERRRKRVSESRSVPEASTLPRVPSPREARKDRKRRRRKRSHRPSNPTLGETGGLPPRREEAEATDEVRS